MKLLFFTRSAELENLADSLEWCQSESFQSPEELLRDVSNLLTIDIKPVVFLDFDSDLAGANFINSELYQNPEVVRIVVTSKLSLKDLKEHQSSEYSAHAYLKMPINESTLKSLVSDLDISDFIEEHNLYEEGSGFPVKELELNKSHSFSFNRELDEEVDQMISDHEVSQNSDGYHSHTNQMIQMQFDKVFNDNNEVSEELGGIELSALEKTSQLKMNDPEKIVYPNEKDLEFPEIDNLYNKTNETMVSSDMTLASETDMSSDDNNDDLELELGDLDENTNIDLEVDLSDEEEPPELELGGEDQDIPSQIHSDLDLELSSDDEVEWDIDGDNNQTQIQSEVTKETFPFEIDDQLNKEASSNDDLSQMVLEDDEEEAYDFNISEQTGEEHIEPLDESFEVSLSNEEDVDLEGDINLEANNVEIEPPVQEEPLNVQEESSAPVQNEKEETDLFDYQPKPLEQNESLRFQSLIGDLRDERAELLSQVNREKTENKVLQREILDLKAELEETKIELSIVRQRHQKDLEMLGRAAEVASERQKFAEEKLKHMQREFNKVEERVRHDLGQVRHREKELESQLELVKMDSESQVELRDRKIIELKRKIDQLEFNMENSAIKEQKTRDDKYQVEQKLEKIMKTLRGSIELLEDDLLNDPNEKSSNSDELE